MGGQLARASALVLGGTIATGVLGYVYQVVMGRMLSTGDYALFSAVMALYAVLSAPLSTLVLVISRKVSEYRSRDDTDNIAHFFKSVTRQAALGGIILAAVCVGCAEPIRDYLRAANASPVYVLAFMLFFTFPPLVNDGFLQGMQKFGWLGASATLRVLLKVLFSAAFVWTGFAVGGALMGTVAACVAGWAITLAPLRELGRRGTARKVARHLQLLPSLPVVAANVAFAAMTQIDVVMVNHYFPAHEAGLYAAASVLGKAVMYLPSGIALALYPMVAENHARNATSAHLLLQAAGMTALLCLGGAAFYGVAGNIVVRALYGADYAGAGDVLRHFGFAITPMALVMVAEYFVLAKGRLLFAYLFVVVAPLQIVAIHFFHQSLGQVVAIVAGSGLLLVLAGYGILWRAARDHA